MNASSNLMLKVFTTQHVARRYLLRAASPKITHTVQEARERLRCIVGSPIVFGQARDAEALNMPLAKSQSELPSRRMLDSYQEAILPITTDVMLKQKYINFHHQVRYGRIMEDLDTMAVAIGYSHVTDAKKPTKSPIVIVTAFVDSMNITAEGDGAVSPDHDVIIRGHVTWAGATSMEISLSVEQNKGGAFEKKLVAKFLMVARDPDNKVKAYINPLEVSTPEEKEYFKAGEASKLNRQRNTSDSLMRSPPTADERLLVHDLFLKTIDPKAEAFSPVFRPPNTVYLDEAKLKNIFICFPEERNLYNKMFGGFLMRQAFELAWGNAYVYGRSQVRLRAVDDIIFRRPVEIGSLLYMSSQVVYTKSPKMEVKVVARVLDPIKDVTTTTNVFHFTFEATSGEIREIMPRSYADYMIYLDGKRHMEQSEIQTSLQQ